MAVFSTWDAALAKTFLYLAAKGHESWGLDFVPVAIERAKPKAAQRGIDAHFLVGNALELNRLGRQFDTVIDCGLFHIWNKRTARKSQPFHHPIPAGRNMTTASKAKNPISEKIARPNTVQSLFLLHG